MVKKNDGTKFDLVRGSLIGGAAGDALGYAVEFKSYQEIITKYGPSGITEYELNNGVAEISDDTQMTLFTANGLLMGLTRGYMRGIGGTPEHYVEYAYKDWYDTQMNSFDKVVHKKGKYYMGNHTWLSALPEMYVRRAPGNTCLTAIKEMREGQTPENDSKGCGGVMRIAPWPLFCACHENRYSTEEIDMAGGEIARLTHKHPLGWLPAMILTSILYRLVKEQPLKGLDKGMARITFLQIVLDAFKNIENRKIQNPLSAITMNKNLPFREFCVEECMRLLELLMDISFYVYDESKTDEENIHKLGKGWVGEEALAIAIYAVARHINSFEDALIAAVNHNGDSDSTGAIAGNIMGAIVGYEAIPAKFKEHLELHDVILTIADDLHQGCIISEHGELDTPAKRQWFNRYCEMLPAGFER